MWNSQSDNPPEDFSHVPHAIDSPLRNIAFSHCASCLDVGKIATIPKELPFAQFESAIRESINSQC